MTTGHHTVLAGRVDRLGFRLRNLMGAWDFARQIDSPLIVNWYDCEMLDQSPFHLSLFFDTAFFEAQKDFVRLDSQRYDVLCKEMGLNPAAGFRARERYALDEINRWPPQVLQFKSSGPFCPPGVDQSYVLANMRALFWSWPLNAAVAAAHGDIMEKFDVGSAVSVHLRRGDVAARLNNLPRRGDSAQDWAKAVRKSFDKLAIRFAPISAYLDAIAALDGNPPLIVYSDDDDVRQAVANNATDRVIDIQSALDAHDLFPAQRAFVELLVMSETRAIIGMESGFSLVPSLIGATPYIHVFDYLNVSNVLEMLRQSTTDHPDQDALLPILVAQFAEIMDVYDRKTLADEMRSVRF